MTKLPFVLGLALALSACAAPPFGPAGKLVTVRGEVRVAAAGPGFKLAAVSSTRVPYELRRLDHIDVYVSNKPAGHELGTLAGTLDATGKTDVDHTFDPVALGNLRPFSSYKVTLQAFQFDPALGEVVRVDRNDDGASETHFDTNSADVSYTAAAAEDIELPAGFKLTLSDQPFSGAATGEVNATDGLLLPPKAPEAVIVPLKDFQVEAFNPADGAGIGGFRLNYLDADSKFQAVTTFNPCGGTDPCADPKTGRLTVSYAKPTGTTLELAIFDAAATENLGSLTLQFDPIKGIWAFASYAGLAPDFALRAVP